MIHLTLDLYAMNKGESMCGENPFAICQYDSWEEDWGSLYKASIFEKGKYLYRPWQIPQQLPFL